jgi:serine protease SohB
VMLDPFLPENLEDVQRLKAIQKEIHEDFIGLVKGSRGEKLRGPESALFSGEYWAGGKALEYGLVDALGDLRAVLRERFGEKVKTPVIAERGWLARRFSGTGEMELSDLMRRPGLGEEVLSALEARALWSRFGL